MRVTTDEGAPAGADAPAPAEQTTPRGGRYGFGWLAAVLAVGLVLGLAAGLLVPGPSQPGEDSAEAGFLRDMSSHHAQAVEMAMTAYQKATDQNVRALGADIALTQHGQVNIMQTWLRTWGVPLTGSQPKMSWMPNGAESLKDGLMPGMATQEQLRSLQSATGKQVDIQFLQLMRAHHLGGIHMAQEIIKLSDHPDVEGIAQTMVAGQQGELNLIRDLLSRHGVNS